MTLATLPGDVPVLAGRLIMHRRGAVKGRPTLVCSGWCPHCRDEHGGEWGDPPIDDPTRVVIIAAPGEAGPFAGGMIALGIDPARRIEAIKMATHAAEASRRWQVERNLAANWAGDSIGA